MKKKVIYSSIWLLKWFRGISLDSCSRKLTNTIIIFLVLYFIIKSFPWKNRNIGKAVFQFGKFFHYSGIFFAEHSSFISKLVSFRFFLRKTQHQLSFSVRAFFFFSFFLMTIVCLCFRRCFNGRFRQSTLAMLRARHAQVLLISLVYKSFFRFFEKPSRPFQQINLRCPVEVWFFGYKGFFFFVCDEISPPRRCIGLCSLVIPLILKVLSRFSQNPFVGFYANTSGSL